MHILDDYADEIVRAMIKDKTTLYLYTYNSKSKESQQVFGIRTMPSWGKPNAF